MTSPRSETEPLTMIKTAELPRYVAAHPTVILEISSMGYFPRTGHQLIADAHPDAVFIGIDDTTLDWSDYAALTFLSEQHDRLGTKHRGYMPQGHHLFLAGCLTAYETYAGDVLGTAASLASGVIGSWLSEKVDSPRLRRGACAAVDLPIAVTAGSLAQKFNHVIASWKHAQGSKALKQHQETESHALPERSELDVRRTKAMKQSGRSSDDQTVQRRSRKPVRSTPGHQAKIWSRERNNPLNISLELSRSSRHHTRRDPDARRRTLLNHAYLTLRSAPEDSYYAIRRRRRALLERHRSGRVQQDLPSSHQATARIHQAWQRICDHKGWKP